MDLKNLKEISEIEKNIKIENFEIEKLKDEYSKQFSNLKKEEEILNYNIQFFEYILKNYYQEENNNVNIENNNSNNNITNSQEIKQKNLDFDEESYNKKLNNVEINSLNQNSDHNDNNIFNDDFIF
jgi:hypothetical protein